jgi:hypothetical protein
MKPSNPESVSRKAALYSALNISAAVAVYWHLITGGWLMNEYRLDDPNIVNLLLALFEPIAILSVLAYWIWRTASLRRLVAIMAVFQILIGAGFLAFFIFFAVTWHPKMM